MKHNGQNIITDKDITLTGEGFQGEELSGVLTNHTDRLNTLESNVKWIYKNGGVGSGSGGGGGDSTNWSAIILRGDYNQPISDKATVFFPSEGNYPIKVQIYKGGQSSFKITFDWINSKGSQSRSTTVSAKESFYAEQLMLLDTNGSFSVTILNLDTQDILVYTINYIVTSYRFSLYYVYADTHQKYTLSESNHNIFMGDVKTRGLEAALEYSIAVEVTEAKYTFKNWNSENVISSDSLGEDKQLKGKSAGIIYLPLVSDENDYTQPGDIIEYLNNNDNANFKQFSLDLDILLEGNTNKENIPTRYLRDNLIPSSLYLKVFTDAGGLFDSSQKIGEDSTTGEDIYSYTEDVMFFLGTAVFQLTPFFNSLQPNRIFPLIIKYDDVEIDQYQLRDQRTQYVSVPITESGEHTITFRISYEHDVYERTYWFFVKESTVNFDWYLDNKQPTYSSYYRNLVATKDFELTNKDRVLRQSNNSSNLTYRFLNNNISSTDLYDQLICVGFQYSSINNIDTPLCSFNCGSNGSNDNGSLIIYQDKVVLMISGDYKDIYLPRTDNLDDSNKSNYHLLSIYKKFERHTGNNYYRGIYVYIDGILEAAFNDYTTLNMKVQNVTLYNCNCLINLLELSYFQHDSDSATTYLNDNDILRYYYSYKERVLNISNMSQKDLNLFGYFESMELDPDNFVKVNNGGTIINNIAENSEIPVLLLSYSDITGSITGGPVRWNHDNFKDWITATYQQESTILELPITISWSAGGVGLQQININGTAASFYITLQGSSTLGYRCKNFELIAPTHNDSSKSYIYSPNFDPGDSSTFLPEKSFTLKADVVDSSHTNNNAIGNFVNKVTTPFSGARAAQAGSQYEQYVKNCLTGFPILLFLSSNYKSAESVNGTDIHDYYFLGIYNFNLGRQSYYNLGYKDTKKLPRLSTGFNLYEISIYEDSLLSGIEVAEIQNNGPYFDFSQHDETILFQRNELDTNYMFGDMVSGTGETDWKRNLTSLLTKTTFAGGYIFDRIGKTYSYDSEDNYGYNDTYSAIDSSGASKNQVPNYRYQKYRSTVSEDGFYEQSRSASEGDLLDLIKGDTAEPPAYGPSLDFVSLSEYYTVCMAFGLVDSVQKNLNIKTWTGNTNIPLWYLAFYDMDTCLGVSNSGSKISYFAFSDYWKSSNTGTSLNPAIIYRDFSPSQSQDTGIGFFDTPSSYIFAVAKYAKSVYQDNELLFFHPANLWAIWRQSSTSQSDNRYGCLSSSTYFMNEYFKHHLAKVPESAFNFNYKYKYFVKNSENGGFDVTNFPKFYGRRINYTEDWLSGRLHILDAYFNINRVEDIIYTHPGNVQILAPAPNEELVDSNNKDILVLRDIFSSTSEGQQYANISTSVNITAGPYSPLIVVNPRERSSKGRYIFPEQRAERTLPVSTSGNQFTLFGGSSLWETLSSINPFITNSQSFYINSKYLTQLTGSTGTCNSWSINIPSIEKIELTSQGYGGSLIFEPKGTEELYPNLNEINITNTGINLTVDSAKITKLVANNMKASSSISITNVSTLTSVSLSGSMDFLVIPAWNSSITLSNLKCNTISISNTKYTGATTLTINNNDNLTELTVLGFETVNVTNCPRLKRIIISDTNRLKTLNVRYDANTIKTTEFTIGTTTNTIDLRNQTNLENIQFINTPVEGIKLPNKAVNLKSSVSSLGALEGNRSLSYIDGNGPYYIIGAYTFRNCLLYTLKQSDGLSYSNIKVKSTTTTLAYTFYIEVVSSRKGSLTLDDAEYFLSDCCIGANSVTNVSYLFYNQNIVYDEFDFFNDYNNGNCRLSFQNLPKCNSFENTLYNNEVYYYNRYMFKGNTSSSISITNMIGGRNWFKTISGYSVVFATYDFLYEILPRLKTFSPINYDDNRVYFRFIDSEGTVLSEIKISDIFNTTNSSNGPRSLTTLSKFSIYPSLDQVINFDNTFNENWIAANTNTNGLSISRFFWDIAYGTGIIINLKNLFRNITLKSASLCFGNIGLSDDDRIDMATFINWDKIGYCTNLFYSRNGADLVHNSLGFNKKITYTDFLTVWNKIITNYKPTGGGIGHLFRSCNIYGWNETEFYLVESAKLKTFTFNLTGEIPDDVEIGNTYTNNGYLYTVKEVNTNNIVCDTDFTDNIPQNSGTLISTNSSNYQNLNFSSVTYIKNSSITKSDCLFLNCRFFTNDEMFRNGEQPQYKSITHDFFAPLPNITRYYQDFYGMYWKKPIPFDFFRRRKQSTRVVYVTDQGDPYTKIPATYYTYSYTIDIDDVRMCFYNIRLENATGFDPMAEYNCGSFSNNRTRIIDENGNSYQTYYDTIDSEQERSIEIPTEETDCDNIMGNYQQSINITGTSIHLENPAGVDDQHLVVPPDILYSISTVSGVSDRLDRVFGSNTTDGLPVFTGLLPKNLLKNIKTLQPTKIVDNLKIVPWYLGVTTVGNNKHIHYYFIPENFSNTTTISSLMTFKLMVPAPYNNNGEKIHYYLYRNDSIPNTSTNISSSLPAAEELTRGIGGNFQPASTNSGIDFHIMVTPSFDEMGELIGIEEGIDLDVFKNLKLSKLIDANLATFISGRIFTNNLNTDWRSGYVDLNDYAIRIGISSYGGLSRRCSLNFPITNERFILGVGTYSNGGNMINRNSISNFEDIEESSYTDKYINFI